MYKKWFGFIILLVIVVTYLAYQVWNNPTMQIGILKRVAPRLVISGSIPEELSENFDPIVSQSTFELVQNLDGQKLKLKQVFPPINNGNLYTSSLVCDKGVRVKFSNETKYTKSTLNEILPLLLPENGPILITGLCNNSECSKITDKCDIYLSGK